MGWAASHRHHYDRGEDSEVAVPFLLPDGTMAGQARMVACACGAVGWRVVRASGKTIPVQGDEPDF